METELTLEEFTQLLTGTMIDKVEIKEHPLKTGGSTTQSGKEHRHVDINLRLISRTDEGTGEIVLDIQACTYQAVSRVMQESIIRVVGKNKLPTPPLPEDEG